MRLLIIILGILIVLLTLISRLRLGLLAAISGREPTLSLRIGPASIHLYPPRKEASPAAPVPEEPKEIRVKKKTEGKLGQAGAFRFEGCLDSPLAAYPAGAGTDPARDPHRSAGPLCHSRRGGRPRRGRQDLRYAGNVGLDRDAGSGTALGDPASAHPCGRRF